MLYQWRTYEALQGKLRLCILIYTPALTRLSKGEWRDGRRELTQKLKRELMIRSC